MGKKKQKVLYDADGARRVMRKRDYMADMGGQLALGVMANLVGQLTYFYTDKVGMAVGGVGIAMMIAKIIDALTDVLVGNMIDHSKGGNKKYYSWMLKMAIPAAVIIIMMFTVPIQAGQTAALIYVLVTNLLLTAVIYTMIATPFSAVMIVRTHSQSERSNMGLFRAVGNYGAGTIIAIITIPVTNMLGGTQSAWIKYGVALALGVLLLFLICYNNGRKAKEIKDISGFTHGIGWCAPQQGTCKLTLNVKEGVIQEALVETIGCSGMTHSAAMASEILPGLTILEALNTDLVCDAINTAMRELFLQIVYGRSQSAFSEDGLVVGAGLEDLGKGLRSQVGTMYGTLAKGPRYLEMTDGYVTGIALDADDEIIGYKFINFGKMMDFIKAGDDANTAFEKASGQYGRVADAVKIVDPRKE